MSELTHFSSTRFRPGENSEKTEMMSEVRWFPRDILDSATIRGNLVNRRVVQ